MIATLDTENDLLGADRRMDTDIDFALLPGELVGQHLGFDNPSVGVGELALDQDDERLKVVSAFRQDA